MMKHWKNPNLHRKADVSRRFWETPTQFEVGDVATVIPHVHKKEFFFVIYCDEHVETVPITVHTLAEL